MLRAERKRQLSSKLSSHLTATRTIQLIPERTNSMQSPHKTACTDRHLWALIDSDRHHRARNRQQSTPIDTYRHTKITATRCVEGTYVSSGPRKTRKAPISTNRRGNELKVESGKLKVKRSMGYGAWSEESEARRTLARFPQASSLKPQVYFRQIVATDGRLDYCG